MKWKIDKEWKRKTFFFYYFRILHFVSYFSFNLLIPFCFCTLWLYLNCETEVVKLISLFLFSFSLDLLFIIINMCIKFDADPALTSDMTTAISSIFSWQKTASTVAPSFFIYSRVLVYVRLCVCETRVQTSRTNRRWIKRSRQRKEFVHVRQYIQQFPFYFLRKLHPCMPVEFMSFSPFYALFISIHSALQYSKILFLNINRTFHRLKFQKKKTKKSVKLAKLCIFTVSSHLLFPQSLELHFGFFFSFGLSH